MRAQTLPGGMPALSPTLTPGLTPAVASATVPTPPRGLAAVLARVLTPLLPAGVAAKLGGGARPAGEARSGKLVIEPFTRGLDGLPAASLTTGAREVPIALLAAVAAPETAQGRRLELVEAAAQLASDRSVLPEQYLPWLLALEAAVAHTAAHATPNDAVAVRERLLALHWKVVEFACRVGSPADVQRTVDAAMAAGGLPATVVATIQQWRISATPVQRMMLHLLNTAAPAGPAADRARRHLTMLLRDVTHA